MQSKKSSALEAVANTVVGWGINYSANLIVLPLFGIPISAGKAFWIGVVFTAISLVRSYVLRRYFNGLKFFNTEVTK
jgi:hypothetical protein